MALDILAQDIIIDETTGLQDSDVDPSVAPHLSNTTLQYLLGLDDPGGLTSPEVAFKANFVVASASASETISSVVLSQDLNGTPFSTTVGVNSGIRTVDGNYVWLFQDLTHPNVVIGVIGTSDLHAPPAADGPLAFSLALISTSNTNADLYTVEYVPLRHPITTNPDDRIDLTDHVFASVTGTTVANFSGQNAAPGNHDFYAINSSGGASNQLLVTGFLGANNATANVSTQGFGVNNQSINPTETLQVDFITGSTLAAGTASQISYGSHLNNIVNAGFTINQITPSNPNLRVDIKITALDVTGNEQGLNFYDGSPSTAAPITSVTLTGQSGLASPITANGTYDVAGSVDVTVSGLGTNVVTITGLDNITTVNITTSSQMDRLLVTGVDSNEGCDITEFHFSTTSTNAHTEEVGSFINFDDDGPTAAIVTTGNSVVMDESIGERPANSAGAADANDTADDNVAGNLFPAGYGTPIGLRSNVDLVDTTTSTGSDNEGATTHVTLSIAGGNGTDSLLLTTDNSQISLFNESGVIVGRVDNPNGTSNAAGAVAFAISINDLGEVTVAQYLSLHHPTSPDNYDESVNLGSLVNAVVTVTDGDGDIATQSIGIGNALQFQDDGPTAAIVTTGNSVVMDESIGERPANSAGAADANDTADDNVAGNLFPAGYGTPIGLRSNVDLVDTTTSTGSDNEGATTHVTLSIAGGNGTDSLLLTTDNSQISLFNESGVIVGRVDNPNGTSNAAGAVAFAISINDLGEVTVAQYLSLHHPTSPDNYDESVNLGSLVNAVVTVTDGDGDIATQSIGIGNALQFQDDGPTISASGTEPTLTVDESSLGDNSASFSAAFTSNAGADGDAISYVLDINQVTNDSGLTDTLTGEAVLLSVNGGAVEGRTAFTDELVFTVSVSAAGLVTLDQARAVIHSPDTGPDQETTLASDDLVTLTATITDGDGDQALSSVNIGTNLVFKDDAPTITVPFDGDASGGGSDGTPESLANTLNASASGAFGYDIGADSRPDTFYDDTHSDFVDTDDVLAGVQIALTGSITGGGGGDIISPEVTLASETSDTATFDFTFDYHKSSADDTLIGTAGGTLVFDKVHDTYTINLTDPLEGFSFDLIHTSELLSKLPTSNVGHPQIVVEQLQADDGTTSTDEDFYVQFTANAINRANPFSLTSNGEGKSSDTTFNAEPPSPAGTHDMVSNDNETWVSATQSTNGVAGDTIQKGELLTLRFFDNSVGIATEVQQTPQTSAFAGSMAIKFDGIGNSEDLMLILNLAGSGADNIFGTADDTSITRAMYVSNDDILKTGHVPSPYSSEFTLDNNDGLVIIEQNDYNAAGEEYLLQGVQIMQSGNGITGSAIELNGAVGVGSTTTTGFDSVDNDVLKITDIAFSTTVTETPSASLDFAFEVADADADQTLTQHILVDVG
ncbi:DUF5801 domain-containing protein [Mesorhizobium sp. C399B]|uniref:DUF5801 repeats-in-toxin domain-containing protein n=1 Tax=Mesorhizobium sp. C399B TaxID=2956833 RepID=UPI002576794F|nr:DUF5801 repeats-in-toxin domain-containing protein [Mesorhizobium sp. C399B]WJI67896.1 DUF5801 domain-containing protein [Mesorhizobium sp. C399B]